MIAAGGQIQGARRRQEDAWRIDTWTPGEILGMVADGLGGHPAGDIASTVGVAAFGRRFAGAREEGEGTPADWLRNAMRAADLELRARVRQDPALRGMATTLVALYLQEDGFWAASVGDSYLLQLRGERLTCLNELHSESGGVTSCVGYNLTRLDVVARRGLEAGDRFLLASDGIATLGSVEVAALLGGADDPEMAVSDLLAAVEEQALPSQDNVTLVAVFA